MAADKKIMAEIETLRLDRPGRVHRHSLVNIIEALRELAATYREEAELWAKSGAKGWKGSEAELYTVATHIDVVATQLDNAGGGAALSVSEPPPMWCGNGELHTPHNWPHADSNIGTVHCGGGHVESDEPQLRPSGNLDQLEAELRESAKRVDALQRTGVSGLDALIADSVRERRGHVRDEFLDPGSPARSDADTQPERKTAHQWNDDPRVDPYVISWSDFGNSAYTQGIDVGSNDWPKSITLTEFERVRDGGAVTVASRIGEQQADGSLLVKAADVTAYLSGAVDTLPGLAAALVPSSVRDMTDEGPENDLGVFGIANTSGLIDEQRAKLDSLRDADDSPPARWCIACTDDRKLAAPGKAICDDCAGLPDDILADAVKLNQQMQRKERTSPIGVPKTWESDTMTADGLRVPGATKAPLLGQPGDAGSGYSHTYVPPGGRVLRFDELLHPVPAAALPPHLSHSQIGNVGDCGVQYRLQRVDKMPQVPQWANIGGTAFHAAVENVERLAAPSHPVPIDWSGFDVELAWKAAFEEQIRIVAASSPVPISVWRASRKGAEGRAWWEVNGPLMLRRYLDARPTEGTLEAAVGTSPVTFIEADLTIDVPTPYGPLPFNAKIDRVTFSEDGRTITIRDYKTSYERPTDTTQLGDYSWVLRTAVGGLAPVKILGTYFDARRGEWTKPVDLLQEHPFEAFQYRVTAAHGQKRALTVGPTPARPSSYCGGCSVRYACPVMNQLAAVAPPPPAPVAP